MSGADEVDRTQVAATDALDATDVAPGGAAPAAGTRVAVLAALRQVGRYRIDAVLGTGGMGLVLLATDPVLGRQVALKLLHGDGGAAGEARRRLLREAQGIARLADENVIVVHEVGTHDDHVYLAMEYVAGATLTRWQEGRGWRELVAMYVRAGRGLLAAHRAGLVHRDFKPDNVLVGDDGRVRVTDFGLVAAVDAGGSSPPAGAPPPSPPPEPRTELATPLTRTGTVMGTPRYMAPEQHLGEPVDARADQFAFCVALYEALFGHRPFARASYAELVRAVVGGVPAPIPPGSPVPPAIQRALLRGLARRRDQRFASMDELLAALTAGAAPPRSRVRLAVLAAGAAAAVAIGALLVHGAGRSKAAAPADATVRPPDDAAIDAATVPLLEAQQLFDQASVAYLDGDFAAAARGFLDCYAIAEFPQVLYNAAASYQLLGRRTHDRASLVEAARYYRRYLAESPQATDKAVVEHTIAALDAEAARLADPTAPATVSGQAVPALSDYRLRGLVVLDSEPPGAIIHVDQMKQPLGTTPWSGWLDGTHHIVMDRPGYGQFTHDLTVDSKKLSVLRAQLTPAR